MSFWKYTPFFYLYNVKVQYDKNWSISKQDYDEIIKSLKPEIGRFDQIVGFKIISPSKVEITTLIEDNGLMDAAGEEYEALKKDGKWYIDGGEYWITYLRYNITIKRDLLVFLAD